MFRISILGFRISRLSMPASETPIDQKRAIMQNKPHFLDAQMNVTSFVTKDYENKRLCRCVKTNPIQTQYKPNSNPIQSQFKAKTNPKRTQSNPISKAEKCCCGLVKLWASNSFHGDHWGLSVRLAGKWGFGCNFARWGRWVFL